MDIKQVISAQNCIVEFNGNEVGSLQNLTIQANNNTTRITNLFAEQNQSFVKGASEYNITATRAFIDLDTYFGTIKKITDIRNSLLQGKKISESDTRTPSPTDIGTAAGTILNALGLNQLFTGNGTNKDKDGKNLDYVLKGGKSSNDFFSNAWFDIKVKSPVTTALQGINIDIINNDLWVLKNCKIVSKTIKIDVGTIVLLDNITIFAKTFNESYVKYEENAQ